MLIITKTKIYVSSIVIIIFFFISFQLNTPHIRSAPGNESDSAIRKITHLQYNAFRLAVRGDFNPIHSSRKLFLAYILDAFMTIEGNRLSWIRENQRTIRAETYQILSDFVNNRRARNEGQDNAVIDHAVEFYWQRIGTRVVLPSSFVGSVRYMQQAYQVSMAMVAKYGNPDLFLTFTFNPKWPELKNNMPIYDDPNLRPDIEARSWAYYY